MSARPHLQLDRYLPYLINRLGSALVASFSREALVGQRLSIAMWRVLAVLSNNGEQRQVDLAGMTSIDPSTLSRLVARLVRRGLVTRKRSRKSNREVVVQLSPKGRAIVGRLIPIARRLERAAGLGLPAKDLEVTRRALRRMHDNMARS